MKKIVLLLLFPVITGAVYSQSSKTLKIRSVREQNEFQWIQEYVSFLSIPNIAADQDGLKKNADFIMQMMKRRNIKDIKLLYPDTKNIPPVIYGEVITPGADKTLIFYAHYDGQPVDSTKWAKPLHPFTPSLVNGSLENGAVAIPFLISPAKYDPDWRLYARGASDDKAGVMAILSAYESIVKAGLALHYNIKFFFEGEEEAGSSHLYEVFEKYKALLQSELWIICDGPVHQSGKKIVSFGVRGDAHVEITTYGPKRPLHSGHYGNWAPNPALMLSHLLASMKEEDGRVLVAGFYDGIVPLSETEKRAVAEAPLIDAELRDELWLGAQENPGKKIEEVVNLPALTIRGLSSSHTGPMASNVVPATAAASLDIRLVKGVDHQKTYERIVAHIRKQGYFVVTHEPTKAEMTAHPKVARVMSADGYNAERISMDLPISKLVIGAVEAAMGPVVKLPTMGGSVPNGTIADALGVPTILVPMANHDNSQHSSNENLRLKNLWDGITLMRSLIAMN